MALCVAWRFVLHGALCYAALCVAWRFVPRGASRVALSEPPYVALSDQKAPHRVGAGYRATAHVTKGFFMRQRLRVLALSAAVI